MGLPVRIVLYAADEHAAREAAGRAFARIADLDGKLSDYRPDSELNRLSGTSGEWVGVSSDLFSVLRRAREIAERTDGAFDPTIGPMVALWRDSRRFGRLPAEGALAAARARTGWRHLEIDDKTSRARLARRGMRLDLGGIAKGFILDEARATLRSLGVTSMFIEAGGDIVTGEAPPGRRGWRVVVPGADPVFAASAAELADVALATSGSTSQFLLVDGVRYSHVVDPVTGFGVAGPAVVHVIASDGATADALATAIGVLGVECAGPVLVRFPGARAAGVSGRGGLQSAGCRGTGSGAASQRRE